MTRLTQVKVVDRALKKLVDAAQAAAHAGSESPHGAKLLRAVLEAETIRVRVLMELYDPPELREKVMELHALDRLIESLTD